MTISAQKLQELESQLSGLEQVKPKNQKEHKKLEQEKETLTRTVASLKAYLALKVGGQVTDGQKFGVIISKTLSLEGMPLAWVSWSGAVEIPEQPERLTVISPQETLRTPNSTVWLALEEIRRDGGTQPRVAINTTVVEEYASNMKDGASFPPVLLFFDGTDYWLSDGFHRLEAALSIGWIQIAAELKQGTQRDAILYSVGANATHGLRRTNADKRQAVMTLLEDEEWSKFSDREIARRCGVGNKFVGDVRRSLCSEHSEKTYTTKHGTVAIMNTANIGKSPSPPTSELPQPTELAEVQSTSHRDSKQLREGLNYQPGQGCEHYVKVEPATWEQLKQYQEEVGTATVDGAIARMLSERTPKSVPTDELCLAITSNVDRFNDQQLLAVVKAIASLNPDLIRQVLESPEEF
jgi:hypothetical protein